MTCFTLCFRSFTTTPGALAGARCWWSKPCGRAALVLLLACSLLPGRVRANADIDSLRQTIVSQLEADNPNNNIWRPLVAACGGADDCLREQIEWAASIKPSLRFAVLEAIGMFSVRNQRAEQAITYMREGLTFARAQQRTREEAFFSHLIGYVYTNLTTEADSAAFYLYRAIDLRGEGNPLAWNSWYTLGYLNDQLGFPQRSDEAAERAYLLAKQGGRRMDYGFALFHLLQLALAHGNTAAFSKYYPHYAELRATAKSMDPRHDAFLVFLEDDDEGLRKLRAYADLPNFRELADDANIGLLYSSLASAYQSRGNYAEALAFTRKAIDHETEIGREGNLLRYYEQLAQLGDATGNDALTVEGLRGTHALRDSMNQQRFRAAISRLEVEYETQKTRTELAESQLALSESRRQRNQLFLGGLALSLMLLGGFLFYQNRLKLQRLQAAVERENKERELAEVRRQAELSNLRALIEGQETERTRVAKDLHDGLGGLLTTVKAHVARLPDTAEAEALIDRACTSVRRIAHNMVPQTLAQSGLAVSLGDLAAQLRVQGLAVDLEISGRPEDQLSLPEQSVLLRIAQELTHNVIKHARASNLLLQLFADGERVLLTVEDDGKGFNLDHAKRTGGLGLGSIEQRVAYLEGSILYDSRPGRGTTVNVEVSTG